MITVYPKHISLKYWAATVLSDYSNEPLLILNDETQWTKWAEVVAGTGSFFNAGVPSPLKQKEDKSLYTDWVDWANVVYNIMNSTIN